MLYLFNFLFIFMGASLVVVFMFLLFWTKSFDWLLPFSSPSSFMLKLLVSVNLLGHCGYLPSSLTWGPWPLFLSFMLAYSLVLESMFLSSENQWDEISKEEEPKEVSHLLTLLESLNCFLKAIILGARLFINAFVGSILAELLCGMSLSVGSLVLSLAFWFMEIAVLSLQAYIFLMLTSMYWSSSK